VATVRELVALFDKFPELKTALRLEERLRR
jgi:hypothetical protein